MRRLAEKRLLVATHNRGKLDEIRAMMAPHGIEVTSAGDMGLPEPAETESSFIGNARIKARAAMQATGLPVLADDSGITVDGLDGALVPADYAQITGSGQMTLFMPRSVRGMKVGGPWGWAPHVRQGQALTDNERDLYHRMPGQPLGTFLINIP